MTTVVDVFGRRLRLEPISINGCWRSFRVPDSDDPQRHKLAILEWVKMEVLAAEKDVKFWGRLAGEVGC